MDQHERRFFLGLMSSIFIASFTRSQGSRDESFVEDLYMGTTEVACIVDEPPSKVTDFKQISSSSPSICIPGSALCGWECRKEPNCTNFNYRSDVGICELFFYTPISSSHCNNCSHFRVSKCWFSNTDCISLNEVNVWSLIVDKQVWIENNYCLYLKFVFSGLQNVCTLLCRAVAISVKYK